MRAPLLMLDLCCGLKGASAAMSARGWDVVTVDIEPRFSPTVVADLRSWSWNGRRPDLVWASPVCTEFSRESMPWCRTGKAPDMSLVEACVRIVRECEPRFWLLENVQGAIRWFRPLLGEPRYRLRPIFLWGEGPVTFQPPSVRIWKKQHTGARSDLKSMIPWHLSAIAEPRATPADQGEQRHASSGGVA